MASPTTFPGDVIIPGTARITGGITPTLARSSILAQSALQEFNIPLTQWCVWDAMGSRLPSAASSDDLGLVAGTWASASPSIQSVDFGGTSTEAFARTMVALPWEYEAGQSVKIRIHAGMRVIADATCELDLVVYKSDEELGISSDLCATAIQDMNSATYADFDFEITATSLSPGDLLDIRVEIDGTDAGDASANITGVIGATKLLCDVR